MTEEEAQGLIILVALIALGIGFRAGYRTGRRDILLGLNSALRTVHNKEQ